MGRHEPFQRALGSAGTCAGESEPFRPSMPERPLQEQRQPRTVTKAKPTCARLAVATVRCVSWKRSTAGSQGMPQCASRRRLAASCGEEVGHNKRVSVRSGTF